MNLSPHFKLEEFINSDTATKNKIDNTPTYEAAANLALLVCHVLEPARVEFGKSITISSGYRCPELNKKVGGAETSQHLYGMAADLQVSNKNDLKKLFDIIKKFEVDQLLFESNSKTQWIHVSYREGDNRNYINDNYKA